jgi:hypothetical protein
MLRKQEEEEKEEEAARGRGPFCMVPKQGDRTTEDDARSKRQD